MKKLLVFITLALATLSLALLGHAEETKIIPASVTLMQTLKAAAEENNPRKAVMVFMSETAKSNAVVESDGAIQVGRELQNPYKIQGTILSEVKPAQADNVYEITFTGNLNGLDRADMKVNSGLAKPAPGPSPTQILFKGIQPESLQNARATFMVTPAGVSLKTLEKLPTR